jgi:hypothetical protein
VITSAAGNATFSAALPVGAPAGWMITATATHDAAGSTSEFSACVALTAIALPGDVDGDGTVGFADLLAVLSAWGPCSACPEDVGGDGAVGFGDLLIVLASWT